MDEGGELAYTDNDSPKSQADKGNKERIGEKCIKSVDPTL
ncbi:hypothetical protein VCR3J2_50063 [Vibrio coralliirubri]|nr:hypothetical protein VCR15J2_10062 [Vibrio coralliirubri]CDT37001.1 hypothetical protein VCR4J2_50074 [Vibrio coralliirubri]CDT99239.1 hypothetical protein VCR3J2_50063 [Vibrio coralliirubri]